MRLVGVDVIVGSMKDTFLARLGRTFLVASMISGFAVSACVEETEPAPPPEAPTEIDPALVTDLQSALDRAVAERTTPGIAIFVSQGDATWSGAAGVRDMSGGAPLSPEDHFRAGSIIKAFVATAVLQSVERGTLALDERLTDLLPPAITSQIERAGEIDVAMLLGHRSGIPEWVGNQVELAVVSDPGHVWTIDEVLGIVADVPRPFDPGQGFSYSNTNYVLLGEILTTVEGKSWRDVLRERVIARAGLEETTLPESGDLACSACARGYTPTDTGLLDTSDLDPSMAGASGGHALVTTPADLGRFLAKLREGGLFERRETLEKMVTFRDAPDPQTFMVGYGYGYMRLEVEGSELVGHLGGTAGYRSFMLYAPATNRYVAGYVNVMGDLGKALLPIIARLEQP